MDRGDLEAVRALLVRMITEGHREEAVDLVIQLLADLREENVSLLHRLREALRKLYGRSSEKLSQKDKELLTRVLGDAGTQPPGATPMSTDNPTGPAASQGAAGGTKTLPEGAAHGRGGKPTGLPEKRSRSPVPQRQRTCPQCGGALHPFGSVDSWQVEYVPGHFVVNTTEREQLSCRRCRDVVVTAPAPAKVIDSGEPGAGLLARILVDKAEDHLPIERQQRRLEREGLTVPVTTLAGWWGQSAELLRPLAGALQREAMGAWLPQVDGTGIDVLDRDHPKGIRQGTIWTAEGGRAVAFVYTPAKSVGLGKVLALRPTVGADGELVAPSNDTQADPLDDEAARSPGSDAGTTPMPGGEIPEVATSDPEDEPDDLPERGAEDNKGPVPRLGGPIQCDGEKLFSSIQSRIGVVIVLVHCWMHARRYFERAVKARDLRAAIAMDLIGRMYDIERKATEQKVSPEERARRRQAETWPLLEQLRAWVLEINPKVPPSTPLGKALRYVERRWFSLVVFVLDGRIPIDNGEVERQIRRIAVGRRNWLFTKGDDAARRLCTVASLCATCRKLGIDPWAYLRDALLAAASGISSQQLARDFTPWAWAEKQTKKPDAEQPAIAV
jgi:transposase